ncbi:MAG: ABC transporter permease [Deltaproteobacteria bacterium]|nr:ABC transporter permease [Deltaproteobacteria bacterium]MBW2121656.1 ABC transporter permease [Deltaproteobacteria bacterium]
MQRFILSRIFQGFLTVWVVVSVVFILGRTTGDPVELMLALEATEQQRVEVRKSLGLDRPLIVQYGIYMARLARLDLGESIISKIPIRPLLADRLVKSLQLAGFSMLVTLVFAFPLGVVAAVRRGSRVDMVARLIAVLGQSLPHFWVGLILMEIFAVRLRWLPVGGAESLKSYVLPGFTMGWFITAGIMRLLRSSMLEVLNSDYVLFAKVKGVPPSGVVWKHALRNALLPVVTFSGMYFALLIGGAVVIETVFAWPGIGRLAYLAVVDRDFTVIQGVVVVIALIVALVNLIVDIVYYWIDPRIRMTKA